LTLLNGNAKADSYINMLKDCVMIAHVEIRARPKWFMKDDVFPHYTFSIRQWAHEHFANRLIIRRGSVKWTSRSMDLNHMDFTAWGYLKSCDYGVPITVAARFKA
jgi:hypothetical protein